MEGAAVAMEGQVQRRAIACFTAPQMVEETKDTLLGLGEAWDAFASGIRGGASVDCS